MPITLPKNYLKDAYGIPGATGTDSKSQFVSTVAKQTSPYGMSTVNGPINYDFLNTALKNGGSDGLYKGTISSTPTPTAPANIYGGQPNTPSGATVNAAGTLTAGGPSAQDTQANQYRAAFQDYLGTLQVSPEEKAAKDYLNSLLTGAASAQSKALESGDTLGFAAGETARVGRQNQLQIDAAARGLDALSGYRAASGEGAKARAEFEKNLLSLTQGETPDPFTLSSGQSRYVFDPATKSYKQAASVAEDPTDAAYKKAQIANIQSQINERKTTTGQYTIPKSQRNNVLKYGFSEQEVNDLEKDIQLYGLDKALEGIGEDMKPRIIEALQIGY